MLVRVCSVCKMTKQKVDPLTLEPMDDVKRYGLYRQVVLPGRFRKDGKKAYHRERGYGGIDLCTECWEKNCSMNKRNTRGIH